MNVVLNKLSQRNLRGSDPAETIDNVHHLVTDAQEFVQAQISNMEVMEQMNENGDQEGLAAAFKSFAGDGVASIDAMKEFKEGNFDVALPAEGGLDKLETLSDSQLSELFNTIPSEQFKG